MTLTAQQARNFYDGFGAAQDKQAFYEDAALDRLIEHADFASAQHVFELGCGTGRFALRLLQNHLPPCARYLGTDSSRTMIDLATKRLAAFSERIQLVHGDGDIQFPLPDQSVDRVMATYVLDLLSEQDIHAALREAHRVLLPGGKLCVTGLGHGVTPASRLLIGVWRALFRLRPQITGGCRPLRGSELLDSGDWTLDYHTVLTRYAVPSEVLIASPRHNS